jgi:TonB family protein
MADFLPLNLIIKPAIILSLFYLAYILFLRNEKLFHARRAYLLSAIVISFVLPHLSIEPPVTIPGYYTFTTGMAIAGPELPGHDLQQAITEIDPVRTYGKIITTIYLLIAGLLFIRFLLRLLNLYRLVKMNNSTVYKNALIIELDGETPPFSFFNYIFLNENQYAEKDSQKIKEHEMAHVNQFHSLDLIIMECLTILQWFNPFAWLCRNSLIRVHEFLADEEVINKGTSIKEYQFLLMNLQTGTEFLSPVNYFKKSLTLNRIKMMTKTRTPQWKSIKFYILMPALTLLALMSTKTGWQAPAESNVQEVDTNRVEQYEFRYTTEGIPYYFKVEKMPDFNNKGQDGFRQYLADNIRYPEEAKEKGIQGRVFVQFMVMRDGSVSHARIVRGINPILDKEALRVVESSPEWEAGKIDGMPVNVVFTFPVNFALDDK